MRILFVMRHLAYLRLFEPSLTILARQGHSVHLAFTPISNKTFDDREVLSFAQRCPGISHETLPADHFSWGWKPLADWVRTLRDFLRYLEPLYANAPKLVRRKEKLVSPFLVRQLRTGILRTPSRRKHLDAFLRLVEDAIPVNRRIRAYLQRIRPDVVLFTPILDGANQMIDHAKAARAEGLPTVLCVASWDNLTNKGMIQVVPDKVTVWNAYQRDEAIRHHGVPAERIALTGAQVFDDWFTRRHSCTREDFLARTGLAGRERYVLYLCSSVFIAPRETAFIGRWLQAVRRTPGMEDVSVLIRPHPANIKQWQADPPFLAEPGVAVWPRLGATPINEEGKRDYFDSLFFAEAVVGVNTSAMIEAGILGKPVFTVLDEDFKDTQEGTIHFHYLVQGGLLLIGEDLPDHCVQLASVLGNRGGLMVHEQRVRRFIADFVRPLGLEVPCAPRLAEEILSTSVTQNPASFRALSVLLRALFGVPAMLVAAWQIAFPRREIAGNSMAIAGLDDPARPLPTTSPMKRKRKRN